MAERVVIDTGPLVALAKANVLDIVGVLGFEFICPPAVRSELDVGAARGRVPIQCGWLAVVPLRGTVHPIAAAVLDRGEASVIQLALDEGIRRVCIDERAGRRIAVAVGLDVVGTLGLLLRAKKIGRLEALRPVVARLTETGAWYDEALLRRVFAAAGE